MSKKRSNGGGSEQHTLFGDHIFNEDNFKVKGNSFAIDALIEPDERLRASAQFRESVKTYGGIFEPIVVQYDERAEKWRIIEGRRRYWTVRDLIESEDLPAKTRLAAVEVIGLPLNLSREVIAASVSLMLNHLRSDNLIADAASLRTLVSAGATEDDIKKLTGISDATLKRTLGLNKLIKPLAKALTEGRMTPALAERCAKLKVPQQERLAEVLKARMKEDKDSARLTGDDVSAVKQTGQREAVTALPGDLFGDEGARVEVHPLRYHFDTVRRLRDGLPANAPKPLVTLFERLKAELQKQVGA